MLARAGSFMSLCNEPDFIPSMCVRMEQVARVHSHHSQTSVEEVLEWPGGPG